jgi:hypothetical protein
VRKKCAGKTCFGLWEYFWGPRELQGVGGSGLGETGRYTWYQNRLSRFHGRVWSQLRRHGVHGWCRPEWSHILAHALALDPQTWPREDVPGLGLIDKDVDLLREVYVTYQPKA